MKNKQRAEIEKLPPIIFFLFPLLARLSSSTSPSKEETHTHMSSEFSSITSPTKATLLTADLSQAGRDVYSSQAAEYDKELAAMVDDSKLAAGALHDELLTLAQDWRSRWGSWCEHNFATVGKFDQHYMHPTEIGFTSRSLDAELGLSLSTDWIQNYAANIKSKAPSTIEAFDEFYRGIHNLAKKNDVTAFLRTVVNALFPLGQFELVDSAVEVHDLQHADPFALIKAEFSASFAVLARLDAQTAQSLEERDACIRSEDIKGAEQRALKAVETIITGLETAYQRHRTSMATAAEIQQFQANVTMHVSHAVDCCSRATQQTEEIQNSAAQDLSKLRIFHEAKAQDDAEALRKYEDKTTKFREVVYDNTKKQMAVWDRILAEMRSLRTLCDERDELIAEHQQDTVDEHRRRQLQREVVASCEVRDQQLQLIAANAANCLELLSSHRSYVSRADEAITRADMKGKLEKMQMDEAIRCYNLYRSYTIQSNTILFRREQRLENIRRLLRSTQFQLNTAIETMDSDLALYREQVRTLSLNEDALAQQVELLHREIDDQLQLWTPVGEFLELRQKYVDPPSLIAQELRRDLMTAHVNAVDELTNNEQKLLDNEKAVVRKILNAVEAAKDTYKEKMEKSHSGA